MPMRMSGLISGLDTDSVISQLVSAKRLKVTRAKGEQTKLSWKQEIWKDLNKDLVSLRSTLSNMRFSSSWNKKTTNVSNTNKASVITGSSAVDSVQSLKITQLAKSGYLTGSEVKAVDSDGNATGENVTALSKLSDLGFSGGETTLNISVGGETSSITVNGDSTISDVLTALKKQGVNASFDENNQRFFISSKSTGASNDFSITANDSAGQDLLDKMGISTYDATAKANLTSFVSYTSDDVAAEALKRAQESADNYKTIYNNKIDAEKTVADLQEQLDELGSDAREDERYKLQKQLDDANAKLTTYTQQLEEASENAIYTGTPVYDSDGKITSIDDVAATDELISEIEQEYAQRKAYAQTQLDAIEAGTLKGKAANKITGMDAQINLNGVAFTSSTNVFDINGLTITALAETDSDETITLTTSDDTSGIYDMVKDFLKSYNNIVNQMDKLYNAESASKYSPLTDEEKEALSETEVEKYEQKIKDGLLKGDGTINSITSALSSIMSDGVEIDGKKVYLSNFGINTLGYFEAEDNQTHAYHIDGDSDDSATSGNADVLKGMIASDPDMVTKFFTKLSQSLYSRMDQLSSRISERRSYGSFFEDISLKSDYSAYDSKISELEEKANDYEDNLYAKFSRMESALAKLQSNTSAITGLLGGG
ncbi:MAG: flagellar filament capping protein FliD [Lachnospiraceae bacterium]|nr:flagellar filament capping protein FliD [Lachnospiraceae bacterium]